MNIYQEHGFDTREEYLKNVAEISGVSEDEVLLLADLLGESEDFDGLVTMIQDYANTI